MNNNRSTAMELLTESRAEAISNILSDNEEYVDCFKQIDDRLNELLHIVPKESRGKLYEIEMTLNNIVSIAKELTYKQGFQDGMNLIKQTSSKRKPKYMIMEFESHRKDVFKPYGGRSGWLYKIVKVLREYVDEAEADRDYARLKAGEMSEDEVTHRNKKAGPNTGKISRSTIWDDYANKYNELIEEMAEVGIDSKKLDAVIEAAEKVDRY